MTGSSQSLSSETFEKITALRILRLISATIYAWFDAWQRPAWFWVTIINIRLPNTVKSIVSAEPMF